MSPANLAAGGNWGGHLGQMSQWPGRMDYQTGWEGLPQFGGGAVGTALQMGLSMIAQQAMGGMGMMPMGLSPQNVADRLMAQRFSQQHDAVIRRAAGRDRARMMQIAEGFAAATGVDWNAPQQEAVWGPTGGVARLMPLAMQIDPMLVDQFFGERGSEAVMAHYMVRGGRYRIDPVTGRSGMSPRAMAQMVRGAYDEAIGGDGGANFYQGAGMSAGQMGQMFMDFQRRGMMPGGPVRLQEIAEFRPGALEAARTDLGFMGELDQLNAGQRDALVRHPEVASAIRAFDGKRVARSLGEWADSIQAMKEIFGEAGYPNAPMPMLVNALNALTAGGMTQLDPGQINTMIRTTVNLAQRSGIGLQGASLLTQQAAVNLRQLGVSETFAPLVAQHGMAFQAAFQGLGIGAYQARGLGDINQIRQMSEQGYAGAIASQMFNQAGLAARLNENRAFEGGTAAANFLQAMTEGREEFQWGADGPRVSTDLSYEDFTRMLTESAPGRLTPGIVARMLQQPGANRAAARAQPNFAIATIRQQRREAADEQVLPFMRSAAITQVTELLGGQGLTRAQRNAQRAIAGGMAGEVVRTLFFDETVGRDVITDEDKREALLAKRMRTWLTTVAAGEGPNAAAARQLLDRAKENPEILIDMVDQMTEAADVGGQEQGWGTLQNRLARFDPGMTRRIVRETALAEARGVIQTASGALGKGTVLRRIMTQIMRTEVGDEAALQKIFAAGMGGVRGGDIAEALGAFEFEDRGQKRRGLAGLRDLGLEAEAAAEEWAEAVAAGDAGRQKQAWDVLEERGKAIGEVRGEYREYLKAKNLPYDVRIDKGFMGRMERYGRATADLTAYFARDPKQTPEERRRIEAEFDVGRPEGAGPFWTPDTRGGGPVAAAMARNIDKIAREPLDEHGATSDQEGQTITFRVLRLIMEGDGATGEGETQPSETETSP